MKKTLVVLLTFVLSIALTACGGSGDNGNNASSGANTPANAGTNGSDTTEPEASAEPITLEFWTLSLKPTFTDYIQGVIDKFTEQHPNITIDWQDLPQDAIQNKLIAATAGGKAPDVVNIWSQLALTLAGKGALVDLNKEATDDQKSIYAPTLLDTAKLGDGIYAFPWYTTPSIQMYNKELYDKAGLQPPKTYEDMFATAKQMKDATGAYMVLPDSLTQILLMNNIPVLSADKKTAAFNTPETLALLNKYKEGIDGGYISKTGWDSWDSQIQQFSTGKLASISTGPQTVKRIKDEAPNIYSNMGIADAIVGSANITLGPVQDLVVPTGSKHVQEAIAFANFLTNDENQLAFCKLVPIFPSTIKAAADPFFTSDTQTIEGQANAAAAKSSAHMSDATLGVANDDEVKKEIDTISEAIFMANVEPQVALDKAEKKVNEMLAKNNK